MTTAHTGTNSGARLGANDFERLMTVDGRLFETEALTPCRMNVNPDHDLWFSPFRDRERAAKACKTCPFIGRCGYNAVASRATHGVWGGEVLPGDKAAPLGPIYKRLLDQFERRRAVELGGLAGPRLPRSDARRRRHPAA